MELTFQEQSIRYLAEKRYEDLRQEQTGEISIPETLPELGRVVDCFGTVLVQDRTVDSGSVTVTGGIQAGVLYVPAGEEGLERAELFLPFTVTKKLPTPEGSILYYWGWLRSIEARFVNSRKLLVRASLGSELSLLSPAELQLPRLSQRPRGLCLRRESYRMRLPLCAAERELQMADEVLMPEELPGAERLYKALCAVELEEQRVLGDKGVFQGKLRLRVLYGTEEGSLRVWTGAVPFSQYVELDRDPGEGASLSIQPLLRHLEIDTDGQPDSHRLLMNVSFVAQCTVWGELPVELTQDAYYLEGSFRPQWQAVELNPCLDLLEREVSGSFALPEQAQRVLDWSFFQDPTAPAPGAERTGAGLGLNLLYYDAEGALRSKLLRQELELERRAEPGTLWHWRLEPQGEPRQQGQQLLLPLRIRERYCQASALRNLCGGTLEPGPREEGPSLVVQRGSGALWDLARENGSTVEALRAANGLETDSLTEERLLLIPRGRGIAVMEEDAE